MPAPGAPLKGVQAYLGRWGLAQPQPTRYTSCSSSRYTVQTGEKRTSDPAALLWSLFRAQLDTSLVTSPRMTPHVKGGEKDEFDNCSTDFHYMFGQVDTWESVTNIDWLMYDTSGASVITCLCWSVRPRMLAGMLTAADDLLAH